MTISGGNFEILDNGTVVASRALTDLTQINIYTPLSATLGNTLTVNYSALGSHFAIPIFFHGDMNAGSQSLVIEGGSFSHETYTTELEGSNEVGTITFNNNNSASIAFDHLTAVTDTSKVNHFAIDGTSAGESINVVNGPLVDGMQTTEVNSGASDTIQTIDFANKSEVTVNGNGGTDIFTVDNSLPAAGLNSLTLEGGTSTGDDFIIDTAPPGVKTNIVGGTGGDNTLFGPDQNNTWDITGYNSGSIAGVVDSFTGIQNLTCNSLQDVFHFFNCGKLSGSIDGGGGGDWLDYAAVHRSVVVNLTTGKASLVGGGVTDVQNVIGSACGGDTLTGAVSGSILVGHGSGNVLVGGAGPNLMIGGDGKDVLEAGNNDDIMIGGSTIYDGNITALDAIFAEWQSGA